MKNLPHILAAYQEIDIFLEQSRTAVAFNLSRKTEARQVLNDQAYFILCWGQLENEINARCRMAIVKRHADVDWNIRRAWDLYNPNDDKFSGLSFDNRVKLVLDQREGRGSPFALTMLHYGLRNRIAHGGLQSTRIGVNVFVQDCYRIQAALNGSA